MALSHLLLAALPCFNQLTPEFFDQQIYTSVGSGEIIMGFRAVVRPSQSPYPRPSVQVQSMHATEPDGDGAGKT